ncbi:MAG: hypothetical protein RR033_06340 [Clostridia bacterium]
MKNDIYDIYVIVVRQPFALAGFELLGRPLSEYVEQCASSFPYVTVDCDKYLSVMSKYEYLAVLYADMALVTPEILQKAARTMAQRRIKKMEIGRGFLLEYGYDADLVAKYCVNAPEFLSVNDTTSLSIVYNILKERIIDKHLANGVLVLDSKNTIVDDTVIIEAGATLEPFTRIVGNTTIQKNAIIGSFSLVSNSLIMENAYIQQSVVDGSVVGKNVTIHPFSHCGKSGEIFENSIV